MVFRALCMSALLSVSALACSSEPQARKGNEDNPVAVSRCIDICGSRLAACSSENPGDYGVCTEQHRDCERECRAQKAELAVDPGEGEVIPPDKVMHPDETTETPEKTEEPESETPSDAPLADDD